MARKVVASLPTIYNNRSNPNNPNDPINTNDPNHPNDPINPNDPNHPNELKHRTQKGSAVARAAIYL
jgi:hypothetical protein